jgi:hypothetical protein
MAALEDPLAEGEQPQCSKTLQQGHDPPKCQCTLNPQSEIYNRLALPEFFIKLLTDESDVILDFFAGSNTIGFVAESLHRRWHALETVEDYLKARKFRVNLPG